jgi:hypothetical protein
MPVDVKGQIVYNPEADDEYTIKCKQLDIEQSGSGVLEEDIESLREGVTKAISDEFKVSPEEVRIDGYSMNINFTIRGPVNHTLSKFSEKDDEQK